MTTRRRPPSRPAPPRYRPGRRLDQADRAWLHGEAGESVQFDLPMSRRTTLRIGGPADAWFEPATIDELARVLRGCAARRIPVIALGAGTNLLVLDGGIPGVVVSTRRLRRLERVGDADLIVEAGVSTGKLLAAATQWGLGGLEFLGGVPGSVGGGLIMNAGTYLGEFTNVTVEVTSVRLVDGVTVKRNHDQCGFVYRGSALPKDEVVVQAQLRLWPRPQEEINADVRALRERRRAREPARVANSGSTFKNPPGDYAGRLIEAAGLKGTRVGDAECSPKHANWLVNRGQAKAADLLALIELVRARVLEVHGVELALEIKIVGQP